MDENDQYEDWIELYNTSNLSFDLSGYYITDNSANLDKWRFPAGTVIPPSGYLILWADEDSSQGPLHTNFKLSIAGEFLALLDTGLNFVDTLSFPQQVTDMGYARVPNGTGPFVIQNRTFAANNSMTPTAEPAALTVPAIRVSPNPANDHFTVTLTAEQTDGRLQLTDISGRMLKEMSAQPVLQIEVAELPQGIYFLKWGELTTKLVITR